MAGNSQVTVSQMTSDDINELMRGTAANVGNPTPEEQWGNTGSDVGQPPLRVKSQAELDLEAQQKLALATSPSDPAIYDELARLKAELDKRNREYGQSENEKGELRRAMQEQMDASNALLAQMQQMQAQQFVAQQQPQPAYPQPMVGPGPAPTPQYGYAPPPRDPFADIGDEDVIQGKQVKRMLRDTVEPAFNAVYQMATYSAQRAQALEAQVVAQSKLTAGITPQDEMRLEQRNPWIRNLAPTNKVDAMAALLKQEQAMSRLYPAVPQSPSAPVAQSVTPTPYGQRMVQQITHVESTPSTAPDLTQDALEAAKQRDLAVVMQQRDDNGDRARAFRQFALKYNLPFGRGTENVVGK